MTMNLKNALRAPVLCALAATLLTGCLRLPPVADMGAPVIAPSAVAATTLPFVFDGDRIFVEVTFTRPDGSARRALAFVNQGEGGLDLSNALFRELDPKPGRPLHLKLGTMEMAVDGAVACPEALANNMAIGLNPFAGPPNYAEAAQRPGGTMAAFAAPMNVEAVIPPGLLQHFEVVFDYAARALTLARPGTLKPEGVAVPIRVNPKTGFAMLDVAIEGARHVFVLDDGGSYSGIRDAGPLLAAHPDRLRVTGGVGMANLTMQASDAGMPVVKVPRLTLGALQLGDVGLLQMGEAGMLGGFVSGVFWDRIYSAKAGESVDGMLGNNVLKDFRLTIDYPNRMTYWQRQAPPDTHELDQVGLTLARENAVTTIAAVAQKNGVDTVAGVAPGDKLIKIDGRDTAAMTRGELLAALHGKPGDIRRLTLERDGKPFPVDAPVTAF
jgi:hypothetical protein